MNSNMKRKIERAQDYLVFASTYLPRECSFRPVNPPIKTRNVVSCKHEVTR